MMLFFVITLSLSPASIKLNARKAETESLLCWNQLKLGQIIQKFISINSGGDNRNNYSRLLSFFSRLKNAYRRRRQISWLRGCEQMIDDVANINIINITEAFGLSRHFWCPTLSPKVDRNVTSIIIIEAWGISVSSLVAKQLIDDVIIWIYRSQHVRKFSR
jgi:hypothetical protein